MTVRSVSDVTRYIKGIIGRDAALRRISIRGELSNFKVYASGHAYFTLKDANSCLKGVMFRSRAQYLRFRPENGMQVVVTGSIDVYERDGVYQLYADSMAPDGEGALAIAFQQLKQRLEDEGLFDEAHKQPLPAFPVKLGIVTSRNGAVLKDIHRVSKRRNPSIQLILYPVQVQGAGAAEQIAAGIDFFNRQYPVDVLIVGRGGGSAEDLWAFNEEPVVRAVYASKIPVISAVGHETDWSLCDFASDVRAATPSHAAEMAVPDRRELLQFVNSLRNGLQNLLVHNLQLKQQRLQALANRMQRLTPDNLLANRRQRIDQLQERLQRSVRLAIDSKRQRLQLNLQKLDMLNPARVMQRGYSVALNKGKTVKAVGDVAVNDSLEIVLSDGSLAARVEKVTRTKLG